MPTAPGRVQEEEATFNMNINSNIFNKITHVTLLHREQATVKSRCFFQYGLCAKGYFHKYAKKK
eukprot:287911-Pelagomonas_calceolata.AAC.1